MILFCTFCWWQQKLMTFKTLDKTFKCKQMTFLSFSRNWYANISYISRVDIVSQGFLMVHFLEERNKIIQVHLNIFPKLWLIFCSQWTIFWNNTTSKDISTSSQVFQMFICSLFDSDIPVTTGGFELRISCIQSSYLTLYAIKLHRLGGFGVPEFATSQQE